MTQSRFALLSIGVVITVLLVFILWLPHNWFVQQSKRDLGAALQAILDTTHEAVLSWKRQQIAYAEFWATQQQVIGAIEQLLSLPRQRDALAGSPAQSALRQIMNPVIESRKLQGFFVISPDNISIASTRNINIGIPNLLVTQTSFLRQVQGGKSALSLPQKSDVPLLDLQGELHSGLPSMFVATPVRNSTGETIAVLAFRINPRADFTKLFQRARVGESGETYAVDASGHLISESRFDDHLYRAGVLEYGQTAQLSIRIADPGVNLLESKQSSFTPEEWPLTKMAASLIERQAGMDLQGYPDYRGVPVVGAWLWDEQLGFGIASEIDVAQGYKSLRQAQLLTYVSLVVGIVLLILLITIYYRNYRRVAESEERFAFALQANNQGFWEWNLATGAVFYSPSWCKFLDYQPEDVAPNLDAWIRLIHPDDRSRVVASVKGLTAGEQSQCENKYRLRRIDGGYITVVSRALAVGGAVTGQVECVVAAEADITQQQALIRDVENSAQRYQRLIDHLGEQHFFFSQDSNDNLQYASANVVKILGYSQHDLRKRWPSIVDGRSISQVLAGLYPGLEPAKKRRPVNMEVLCKDDSLKVLEVSIFPVIDDTGHVIGWEGMAQDISERKAMEQALAMNEERFKLALQGSNDGLWDWNIETDEVYYTDRVATMLGYLPGELPGSHADWLELVHVDDQAKFIAFSNEIVAHDSGQFELEYRMRHKDGSYLDMLSRGLGIQRESDGKLIRVIGINTDISVHQEELRLISSRLRFETLLASISADFIDMSPEDIPKGIDRSLADIGQYMEVDRITLSVLSEDRKKLSMVRDWVSPGHPSIVENLAAFDTPHFAQEVQMLESGEPVILHDCAAATPSSPLEEYLYKDAGIKSLIIMPLQVARDVITYLGASMLSEPRIWNAELVVQFKLVSEVMGNALARHQGDARLKALTEQLHKENILLKEEINLEHSFEEMIGSSPSLKEVQYKIEQVAATPSNVLILGESGTGKELVARAIHHISPRKNGPMISINCAAIAPTLLESELFGHEKGAFTGAHASRVGRFEVADGGTLFLDEIGEMELDLQSKLLRVLQEGEFERVGSNKTYRVDVRIISATNRDLQYLAHHGKFREDLYYRLNVFPIKLPSLRDRSEDIPMLVRYFVEKFARDMGKELTEISPATMRQLERHRWPGNIRELRNVIERGVIISPGPELCLDEYLDQEELANKRMNGQTLVEVERQHIISVLEQTEGRIEGKDGAAKILDINPGTLRSRMKKYNIGRTPGK